MGVGEESEHGVEGQLKGARVLNKRRWEELRVTWGWLGVLRVWEGKSETVDFWPERVSPFRQAHCDRWAT